MRIYLIAVGTRMPGWVRSGYDEYARRLPRSTPLELTEVSAGPRRKGSSPSKAKEAEGKRMLAALPQGAHVVCLDERGIEWSTRELARQLDHRRLEGSDLALLVGGPDGLAPSCLERCHSRWSLSPLTLPHGLVRVVVAEQLYRAWSLLNHHPYHRD